MNTVTFPYLGLTFEMNPSIQIFGLEIACHNDNGNDLRLLSGQTVRL